MALLDEIKQVALDLGLELEENGNKLKFKKLIAERKVLFFKRKLEYSAKIEVKEEGKEVKFAEMLKESGFGSSSGGIDGMTSPGVGFKVETYSSGMGGRSGTIKEVNDLFGKKYSYSFNYEEIRNKIEEIVKRNGYEFKYSIL